VWRAILHSLREDVASAQVGALVALVRAERPNEERRSLALHFGRLVGRRLVLWGVGISGASGNRRQPTGAALIAARGLIHRGRVCLGRSAKDRPTSLRGGRSAVQ